jgi:hypothetical protein
VISHGVPALRSTAALVFMWRSSCGGLHVAVFMWRLRMGAIVSDRNCLQPEILCPCS